METEKTHPPVVISPPPPVENNSFVCAFQPTWKQRLGFKLFPRQYCQWPEVKQVLGTQWGQGDGLCVSGDVKFTWKDRFRILFSGRARIVSKTITQHHIGSHLTNAVTFVQPPKWMDVD